MEEKQDKVVIDKRLYLALSNECTVANEHTCRGDSALKSVISLNFVFRYGNNTRSYVVRVGDYHTLVPEEYEEEIGVQEITLHKEYRPDSSDYDIALVRLQGPEEQCARFSTHVLPACLPLRRERPQKTAPNCYITGWGDTGKICFHKETQAFSSEVI